MRNARLCRSRRVIASRPRCYRSAATLSPEKPMIDIECVAFSLFFFFTAEVRFYLTYILILPEVTP